MRSDPLPRSGAVFFFFLFLFHSLNPPTPGGNPEKPSLYPGMMNGGSYEEEIDRGPRFRPVGSRGDPPFRVRSDVKGPTWYRVDSVGRFPPGSSLEGFMSLGLLLTPKGPPGPRSVNPGSQSVVYDGHQGYTTQDTTHYDPRVSPLKLRRQINLPEGPVSFSLSPSVTGGHDVSKSRSRLPR